MKIDKSKFKDAHGRYITQGLFLEQNYNTDLAVFTYDGEDKEYNGVVYPSLKKLFIEEGDPTEYLFANRYLYDWNHWQRLCNNAIIGKHVEQWREELVLSLRAEGITSIITAAIDDKHYQASKWLADKGWMDIGRGRPSKAEIEGELKKRADQLEDDDENFELLKLHKGKS